MKLILMTIVVATVLPIVLHWSRYQRMASMIAGATWAFFIAPPALVLGIMIFHAVMTALGPPCFMPTGYHIDRISALIQGEGMGWGDEVEQAFKHLKQCKPDKKHIAEKLLSDDDGTVVALGMDVVVQESFDRGDLLLRKHHGDMRWNYYLASNDEYSKFMLVLWKMKKDMPLTVAEKEAIEGWSDEYFEKVGIIPLARAESTE